MMRLKHKDTGEVVEARDFDGSYSSRIALSQWTSWDFGGQGVIRLNRGDWIVKTADGFIVYPGNTIKDSGYSLEDHPGLLPGDLSCPSKSVDYYEKTLKP